MYEPLYAPILMELLFPWRVRRYVSSKCGETLTQRDSVISNMTRIVAAMYVGKFVRILLVNTSINS